MEDKQKLISFKDFLMEDIEYEFLAELFPKNAITLIHGIYGSGKSYSTIKAFNKAGIKPYYINLDYSAGLSGLDCHNLNEGILDVFEQVKEFDEESVVIIDTYTVLDMIITSKFGRQLDNASMYTYIDKLRKSFGGTLVIVAHTADLVTKDGVFKDNNILARNAAEVLWLEKVEYKATAKKEATIKYTLHVNKGRGNGGSRLVPDWMREDI